ncbi:hypothetical protein LCGC14_1506240 [marine sediment metagenome]|uniref:Uncharacterized protein n=1 Tax=marine sediment metagenome TaxID=412755 RepID=A0A0F9J2N6_9ZZZZ
MFISSKLLTKYQHKITDTDVRTIYQRSQIIPQYIVRR